MFRARPGILAGSQTEERLDNLVVLFGLPRSGTTIMSRLIANHSRVMAIIEPYQTRRATDYEQTGVDELCRDFSVEIKKGCSLLVKETTTRRQNTLLVYELMKNASTSGIRTAYIFMMRSPLESFLSQVEAAEKLWQKAPEFRNDSKSLKNYWNSFTKSMDVFFTFAFNHHGRFVFFDEFVARPTEEIGRMMGLFGYALEPGQMDVSQPAPSFGGDPKAREGYDRIAPRPEQLRSDKVTELGERFGGMLEFEQMLRFHDLVKNPRNRISNRSEIMRDLALILAQQ